VLNSKIVPEKISAVVEKLAATTHNNITAVKPTHVTSKRYPGTSLNSFDKIISTPP